MAKPVNPLAETMMCERIDARRAGSRKHARRSHERLAIAVAVMFQVTVVQRAVYMLLAVVSPELSDQPTNLVKGASALTALAPPSAP